MSRKRSYSTSHFESVETPKQSISNLSEISKKRPRRTSMSDFDKELENVFPHKQFFSELKTSTQPNKKFRTISHFSTFVLRNLDVCSRPEEALKSLFTMAIRNATINAEKELGGKVTHLGVLITAEDLRDPIKLFMRTVEQTSVDMIVAAFQHVNQSAYGGNLMNKEIHIRITTISLPQGGIHGSVRLPYGVNKNAVIVPRGLIFGYCLFSVVELTRLYVEYNKMHAKKSKEFKNAKHKYIYASSSTGKQLQMVEEFMDKMGILEKDRMKSQYGMEYFDKIQETYDKLYPNQFRLLVFSEDSGTKPIYKNDNRKAKETISIILSRDNHFFGVKKINTLFHVKNYCVECESSYDTPQQHRFKCPARCYLCCRVGPAFPCEPEKDVRLRCESCNFTFTNNSCHAHHVEAKICRLVKKCSKCGVIYNIKDVSNLKRNKAGKHECDSRYCHKCGIYHTAARGCHIDPREPKKNQKPYRIIAFDMESTQERKVKLDVYQHMVNFISARVVCTKCIKDGKWTSEESDCKICGVGPRHKMWNGIKMNDGREPLEEFVEWLLKAYDRKYKTIAFAHFGGKYDNHFILQQLYRFNSTPEVLATGNKIYDIMTRKNKNYAKVHIRDSYNLLPTKLENLPKMFGLEVEDKGFFPHLYNKKCNYHVLRDCLPPIEDYIPDSMMPEKYKSFLKWYEENYNTPFLLDDQIEAYGPNDTKILLHALVKDYLLFLDIADNNDIFENSTTIASASMNLFRLKYLQADKLAIVPERGYERFNNQSAIAIKFLEYYAKSNDVHVSYAGNGGEKRIGEYFLDGYVNNGREEYGLEVLGCFWHGCPLHTSPQDKCVNGKTAKENYEKTLERSKKIRENIPLVEKWECEIQEELKKNKEMKRFFDNFTDTSRLDPRQAFSGGRVGPLELLYEVKKGEKISVLDVVSLYPYTLFKTAFPIGIPKIVDCKNQHVNWTSSAQNPHRGIIKCKVLPNQDTTIPVLPLTIGGFMCFPLCYACAKMQKTLCGQLHSDYQCNHSDEERSFIITSTSIELNLALDNGYAVTQLYKVWEYEEWDSDIFRGYISDLFALKIKVSKIFYQKILFRQADGRKI